MPNIHTRRKASLLLAILGISEFRGGHTTIGPLFFHFSHRLLLGPRALSLLMMIDFIPIRQRALQGERCKDLGENDREYYRRVEGLAEEILVPAEHGDDEGEFGLGGLRVCVRVRVERERERGSRMPTRQTRERDANMVRNISKTKMSERNVDIYMYCNYDIATTPIVPKGSSTLLTMEQPVMRQSLRCEPRNLRPFSKLGDRKPTANFPANANE